MSTGGHSDKEQYKHIITLILQAEKQDPILFKEDGGEKHS